MQEIAAAPLTAEEEKALAIKARQGSSRALDKLITASLPLVVSTARRYQRSRLPQALQWDGPVMTLSPAGMRKMHTLRKLPTVTPSRNTNM